MDYVTSRIEAKLLDYDGYDFTMRQSRVLNVFFSSLSQEVCGAGRCFYTVCMAIPRILLRLESSIYIMEDEETFFPGRMFHRAMFPWSRRGPGTTNSPTTSCFPARISTSPSTAIPSTTTCCLFAPPHNIIGSFVMRPVRQVGRTRPALFWRSTSTVSGSSFITGSSAPATGSISPSSNPWSRDIGHNVIVPNMYFKLYFNRLKRQIEEFAPDHRQGARHDERVRQAGMRE